MYPARSRTQRIIATALIRAEGKLLLVRSSQVQDRSFMGEASYFDVPRLLVDFGEDPTVVLADFCAACGIDAAPFTLQDVQHYLTPNTEHHVFELIYQASVTTPTPDRPGRLLFAEPTELSAYLIHSERTMITHYL